jgi:predicted RNA binding protein YcfA (HicA-like mRNA interferase family)
MTRSVHVPYTVEQDEDGVWCAHAQLRPGVGARGRPQRPPLRTFGTLSSSWSRSSAFRRADCHCRRGLMPPVPSVRGERLVRALERAGFKVARVAGSHHVMRHPDGRGTTVPVHAVGTWRRARCATFLPTRA